MFGYVYLITNNINNKIYVGQHKYNGYSLDENYFGSGQAVKSAVDKYGIDNFSIEILQWVENKEEMNEREIYWQDYFSSKGYVSYNLIKCGGGFSFEESPNWEYYHKMFSEQGHNQKHTPERDKKISEMNTGKRMMFDGSSFHWVFKEDIEDCLNKGWTFKKQKRDFDTPKIPWNKGKKGAQIGSVNNRKCITNGEDNKFLYEDEALEFISNNPSWRFGMTSYKNLKQNKP